MMDWIGKQIENLTRIKPKSWLYIAYIHFDTSKVRLNFGGHKINAN